MKTYEIYFSPTGGTQKAADILTCALSDDIVRVDLINSKIDLSAIAPKRDDCVVIASPSYGGRVPRIVSERLASVKGGEARSVLLCVYGNRAYDDTLLEMSDIAKRAGFRVVGAVAAVAEHSIARQFASGRPDEEDSRKLGEFARKIRVKLSGGDCTEPVIPGNRPYKSSIGVGLVPKPSKECVKCGACANACPVRAIDLDDPKKINEAACISCMRCVSVCPYSARKLNSADLIAVDVMLKAVCSKRKDCELFL